MGTVFLTEEKSRELAVNLMQDADLEVVVEFLDNFFIGNTSVYVQEDDEEGQFIVVESCDKSNEEIEAFIIRRIGG